MKLFKRQNPDDDENPNEAFEEEFEDELFEEDEAFADEEDSEDDEDEEYEDDDEEDEEDDEDDAPPRRNLLRILLLLLLIPCACVLGLYGGASYFDLIPNLGNLPQIAEEPTTLELPTAEPEAEPTPLPTPVEAASSTDEQPAEEETAAPTEEDETTEEEAEAPAEEDISTEEEAPVIAEEESSTTEEETAVEETESEQTTTDEKTVAEGETEDEQPVAADSLAQTAPSAEEEDEPESEQAAARDSETDTPTEDALSSTTEEEASSSDSDTATAAEDNADEAEPPLAETKTVEEAVVDEQAENSEPTTTKETTAEEADGDAPPVAGQLPTETTTDADATDESTSAADEITIPIEPNTPVANSSCINNTPPVAQSDGPNQAMLGKGLAMTAFEATASSDSDGNIVSYEWDFGDGQTASGASVIHGYSSPGSYAVTVQVTDNCGATNQSTITLNVVDAEPPTDAADSSTSESEPSTETAQATAMTDSDIAPSTTQPATETVAATKTTTPADATVGICHIISRGDTLSGLATFYGVDWGTLAAMNNVNPAYYVILGERFFIPTGTIQGHRRIYRIREGDTMMSIGSVCGILPAALASINGMAVDQTLVPGQFITLPAIR